MRAFIHLPLVLALCAAPWAGARAEEAAQAEEAPPKPLWLEAEIGISSMNMSQLAFAYGGWGSALLPKTDDGVALQVAAGGRWRWLTFGARTTTSRYSAYAVHVVGGELGVQWPVRWVEPRIQLHGGYAWHGPADLDLPSPGLAGPAFGGGVGLRMPLGEWFVVGLSFDMDLMFLTGKIRLADQGPGVNPSTNAIYQWKVDTGQLGPSYSGKGYQLRTMLTLGLRAW